MVLTSNSIRTLPFPYFYVDETYYIHHQSCIAEKMLTEHRNFLDLVSPDFRDKAIHFLKDRENRSYLHMPLYINESSEQFYVYKLFDETIKKIHLFCFNPDSGYVETKQKECIHEQTVTPPEHVRYLAAGIAHEIRNPLTTIKGFIQLIKPYLVNVNKEDYANVALDEIDRVEEIIQEFLLKSEPQIAGKHGVTLAKLLNDVFILYENEAISYNIHLIVEPVIDHVSLTMEVQQIKQVLANIIKNAFDAIEQSTMSREGRITISTRTTASDVCINITDNGIGMDQEKLEHLFQPFYTTKRQGTGIGLPICKEIIEKNNGKITAKSTPGVGTTFSLCLPIHKNIIQYG